MIIGQEQNDTELLALVSSIKNHMNEWQIANVNIKEDSPLSREEIMNSLLKSYSKYEGLIYGVSDQKILMIVRLGALQNYAAMKSEIEDKIPGHCCSILLRKMSALGIKQMQINLSPKKDGTNLADNLYNDRKNRKENIILVADDDVFLRNSISKVLGFYGEVIQVGKGEEVVTTYLKHNPDILLLDIHMPDITGLELIPKLIEVDPDAFIIILSADSQKENVMLALEEGAAGFLTKPPQKQKLQEHIGQCITIH